MIINVLGVQDVHSSFRILASNFKHTTVSHSNFKHTPVSHFGFYAEKLTHLICRMIFASNAEYHYGDVIMGVIASQITSLTIVYSIVYSDADQRKHQSSASLAFVWGIHQGPVTSPHKWPVTWKMFQFDDVIMSHPIKSFSRCRLNSSWYKYTACATEHTENMLVRLCRTTKSGQYF